MTVDNKPTAFTYYLKPLRNKIYSIAVCTKPAEMKNMIMEVVKPAPNYPGKIKFLQTLRTINNSMDLASYIVNTCDKAARTIAD